MQTKDLIIGTANFSSKYGYKKKTFSSSELGEIFKILKKNKINSFDTAQSYGFSEKILGKKINKKKIFTKFSIPNIKSSEIETETINLINKSFKNLKKKNLEAILVHNSDFFIKNKITQLKIIKLLKKYKKEKKIKKIGFSIYTPSELINIINLFTPDFFQIPINILDQRFIKKKILNEINKRKIEIHARSVFLQGKILRSNQFKSIIVNKKITQFHNWCNKKRVSRVSACLNFIRNYKFINKIIIGIDNKSQLKKIINIFNKNQFYVPNKFKVNNYNLIDPRKIK